MQQSYDIKEGISNLFQRNIRNIKLFKFQDVQVL